MKRFQLVKYENEMLPSGFLLGEISADLTLNYLKSIKAPQNAIDIVKDIELSRIIYRVIQKSANTTKISSHYWAKSPKGDEYGVGTGRPLPIYITDAIKKGEENNLKEGWSLEKIDVPDPTTERSMTKKEAQKYLNNHPAYAYVGNDGKRHIVFSEDEIPQEIRSSAVKTTLGELNSLKDSKNLDFFSTVVAAVLDKSFNLTLSHSKNGVLLGNIVKGLQYLGAELNEKDLVDFVNNPDSELNLNLRELLPERSEEELTKIYDILASPRTTTQDMLKNLKEFLGDSYLEETDIFTGISEIDMNNLSAFAPILSQTMRSQDFANAFYLGTIDRESFEMMFPEYTQELMSNEEKYRENPEEFLNGLRDSCFVSVNPEELSGNAKNSVSMSIAKLGVKNSGNFLQTVSSVFKKPPVSNERREFPALLISLSEFAIKSEDKKDFKERLKGEIISGIDPVNQSDRLEAVSKLLESEDDVYKVYDLLVSTYVDKDEKKEDSKEPKGKRKEEEEDKSRDKDAWDKWMVVDKKEVSKNANLIISLLADRIVENDNLVIRYKNNANKKRSLKELKDKFKRIPITKEEKSRFSKKTVSQITMSGILFKSIGTNSVTPQGAAKTSLAVSTLSSVLDSPCEFDASDFVGVMKCSPLTAHKSKDGVYLYYQPKNGDPLSIRLDKLTKEKAQEIHDEILSRIEDGSLNDMPSEQALTNLCAIRDPSTVVNKGKEGALVPGTLDDVSFLVGEEADRIQSESSVPTSYITKTFMNSMNNAVVGASINGIRRGTPEEDALKNAEKLIFTTPGILEELLSTDEGYLTGLDGDELSYENGSDKTASQALSRSTKSKLVTAGVGSEYFSVVAKTQQLAASHNVTLQMISDNLLLERIISGDMTKIFIPGSNKGTQIEITNPSILRRIKENAIEIKKAKEGYYSQAKEVHNFRNVKTEMKGLEGISEHEAGIRLQEAMASYPVVSEDAGKALEKATSSKEKLAIMSIEIKRKACEGYIDHVFSECAKDELSRIESRYYNKSGKLSYDKKDDGARTRLSAAQCPNVMEALGLIPVVINTLNSVGPVVRPPQYFGKNTEGTKSEVKDLLDTGMSFKSINNSVYTIGMRTPPENENISGQACDAFIHIDNKNSPDKSPDYGIVLELKVVAGDTDSSIGHLNASSQVADMLVAVKNITKRPTVNTPAVNCRMNSYVKDKKLNYSGEDTLSSVRALGYKFNASNNKSINLEGISGKGFLR